MRPIATIRQIYRRYALRHAVVRAHGLLVRQVPHCDDALFDRHFLLHRGMEPLENLLRGVRPDARELADAWADGWGFRGERRSDFVRAIVPVAERFLGLLEREWFTPASAGGVLGPIP